MKLIYGNWQKVRDIDHHESGLAARREREEIGVSISTVAKLMGISVMYLSDLERGNRAWNVKLADKFTAAVGQLGGRR